MTGKGYFITFEGGEGVGKTTQLPIVAERIRSLGRDVVMTREPGGTELGERLRATILKADVGAQSPMTQALLFNAARSHHIDTVIRPALSAGRVVLCDRFADTTFAYQGYAHGLGIERMEELHRIAFGGMMPDLTVLFDVPEDAAYGTLTEMNVFEREGSDWLKKGLFGFRELAGRYPARYRVINARGTIPEVTGRIMEIVEAALR
ncbi:MAG: dTMP kinase [Rickettsiales bacterium]|jgi:dTMP kinase|nr:dTMP kinase [Rickettsiales bacterium]